MLDCYASILVGKPITEIINKSIYVNHVVRQEKEATIKKVEAAFDRTSSIDEKE